MATPAFATTDQLDAYLQDSPYTAPDPPEAARLILRASELIDRATGRGTSVYWVDPPPDPFDTYQDAINRAALAQVEFWLEVGEEHDVLGLSGGMTIGRVQYQKLPPRLAPRARDILADAGLLSGRISIQ